MGFWGGITTKISTFVFGIVGCSLPIIGFMIWWGRRRNPQKNSFNEQVV